MTLTQVIRDLLVEAEEMAERHADDRRDCRTMGSEEGEMQALRNQRATYSTIRKARCILAQLEQITTD